MSNKGLLLIMSGPSGVGKGTIRKELFKRTDLNLFFSVSMTTRSPRNNEINGKDYWFVTKEEFQKNIDDGNLLEWAEFVGNRYGTPKDKVEEARNLGKNVVLEIEVNGAKQVLDKLKEDDRVISVFVMPPSLLELENRIRNRKSGETEEIICERLEKARKEISLKENYMYSLVNDDVALATETLANIVKNQMQGA